jgi:hypothetical protein
VQSAVIRRAATKAGEVWRISFLDTFFNHMLRPTLQPAVLGECTLHAGCRGKDDRRDYRRIEYNL